jgi:hypothetical protein
MVDLEYADIGASVGSVLVDPTATSRSHPTAPFSKKFYGFHSFLSASFVQSLSSFAGMGLIILFGSFDDFLPVALVIGFHLIFVALIIIFGGGSARIACGVSHWGGLNPACSAFPFGFSFCSSAILGIVLIH